MSQLSGVCIFTETYYPIVGEDETQAQVLVKSLIKDGFSIIFLTRHSNTNLKKRKIWGSYRIPAPIGWQLKPQKVGPSFYKSADALKVVLNYDFLYNQFKLLKNLGTVR